MEVTYFYLIVLLSGIIIAVIATIVYNYAHRADIARKRIKKLIKAYIKEKAKQKKTLNLELAKIDKLYEEKSIDKETCERLKNVLIVMKERENENDMDLLKYVKNGK